MTEAQLLEASTADLAGLVMDCECGRRHVVDIGTIQTGRSMVSTVVSHVLFHHPDAHVVLADDTNTAIAQGDTLLEAFLAVGVKVTHYTFSTPDGEVLVPDEKTIGSLLTGIPRDTGLLVGVGSGTLNDVCRFVGDRMKIPYLIMCTAPSVDGYASTVSPLILKGHKTTLEACYPTAIFADTAVLQSAPSILLQAGFGDLLGKITALTDWELARRLHGEYHCPLIERLVRRALESAMAGARGIAERDVDACEALFDALTLSGIAMGMVGNSRPASGAEHHMSHYWEMDALKHHLPHALHGNAVGVATVVVARVYEEMADLLPDGFVVPEADNIRTLLLQAGAALTPSGIGITRALFHRSLLEAMHVRPRFTILRLADEAGRLEKIADKLTNEYYELAQES